MMKERKPARHNPVQFTAAFPLELPGPITQRPPSIDTIWSAVRFFIEFDFIDL
jgi:hypothetical protein